MAEGRPQVVYSDVAGGSNLQGQLFAGKSFFIAQRCPMRSSFVEQVKSNGGKIVPLEKLADYLIVDHMRKDIPAGGISYKFIEQSIRNGELEDPEDHRAGEPAGTVREIGSSRPTKSGRVPFSAEDDRQLYNWIKKYEREGGAIMGNEIYKQLEQMNSRHPWQSWRDRYVKQLQYKPPPGCAPANGPLSPPSDVPPSEVSVDQPVLERLKARKVSRSVDKAKAPGTETDRKNGETKGSHGDNSPAWTSEDWDEVYNSVRTIQETPALDYIKAWEKWAKGTSHTGEQWRIFFEKEVLPRWEKDQARKHKRQPSPRVVITTPKKNAKLQNPANTEKLKLEDNDVEDSPIKLESPAATPSEKRFENLVYEMMESRKGEKPMDAYKFYFVEHRHELKDCNPTDYSAPHRELLPRWRTLPEQDKAYYLRMEAADKERHRLEKAPTEYREWRLKTGKSNEPDSRKRSREEGNEVEKVVESPDSGSNKRPRKEERLLTQRDEHMEAEEQDLDAIKQECGTMEEDQDQIEGEHHLFQQEHAAHRREDDPALNQEAQIPYLEIPDNSESGNDEEERDDNETLEEEEEVQTIMFPRHRVIDLSEVEDDRDDGEDENEEEQEMDEEDEIDANEETALNHPFSSPTPRGSRYGPPTTLDTQAILADATQILDDGLAELPNDSTQSETSSFLPSSPFAGHTASDGTSHSIREFRSLQDLERERNSTPPLDLDMPPPDMDSDPESYSQNSELIDPDPPLDHDGTVLFYHKMLRRGYEDELIKDVMRACITRAKLSESVLAEVAQGKPWPQKRGVWTEEDDRDLESTDAKAVRRVMKKHTEDEWGGCEERRLVLDYIRRVSENQPG